MTTPSEQEHLDAALQGDQQAYTDLVEPYRPELLAHCYRLTGSMQDAEDMVQETRLRAWSKLGSYAGLASLRAWMYKIATNACLDDLKKQRRRLLPSSSFPPADPNQPFAPPISELIWLEPFPDELLTGSSVSPEASYSQRENISLAFTIALQNLAPRQRAVLLLRDVLGWRANETAKVLEMSLSSVNSALFRARKILKHVYYSAPETSDETASLLDRYVQAWERADIDGLVKLIKTDAQFTMPPSPSWYQGRDAIIAMISNFMFAGDAVGRWRLTPVRANAQPAYAFYQRVDSSDEYQAFGIHVLAIDGGEVASISHFLHEGLFPHFGLPEQKRSSTSERG